MANDTPRETVKPILRSALGIWLARRAATEKILEDGDSAGAEFVRLVDAM